MSRTTRRRPYGFNKNEPIWLRAKAEHEPGHRWNDINRNDIFNNRDAKSYGDTGCPSNRGPKGYEAWDTVSPSNRRWAKRGASKVLRRRADREIVKELRE